MAETIDKIQVEVEATAKGTSQVFKELTSNLQTLKSALSSIDTSKLSQVNKASNKIKVDTSGMTKAQKDVESSVNSIKQALAGLQSLKNAALGGDSSSATSFNRRVIAIQSNIDVLKEKLSQLGNTSVPTQAFTDLDSKIETTRTKLQDLESKYASMGGKAVDLGDLTQTNSDIETTKTELDSLIAKQQELINTGQAYTDPFSGYRDSIEEVQSTLASASSEVQTAIDNMSNSASSADTSGLANGLGDVADKAKEAASSLWSMTKSGIKSGFSSLKNSLSKIKDTLTNIGKKASSSVSTGFSKILKYAFGIRSMYVLFRRLRSAVKDSFTELQNSGAYYQTTKANIDALKSSLSTLKYQFGAAFEPIFNTVAPALQTLINYLVTVMNTISAFIAKLTGKSTYSKAVASTAAIAANTGSAAGSAAELNKQLQGFDELNNLDLDSGSSGGSGGGGSSNSGSVQYVEESVDSALTSFWDSLSNAITNGEWYKAGTLISNALTEALNSINWDSIFQSASNFGTGLADFLNGLITDDLFSAVGTTIANALKTALIAALTFGTEFDWSGLGTAIASGINAFVEANPLDLLVSAFNVWANGILTTLITAIDTTSWKAIAQHIADAIGNLDVGGITWKLGKLVTSLVNAVKDLVSNKETWTNLGNKIAEGINGFFEGFEGSSVAYLLNNLISGLQSMITTALKKIKWSEVAKDIVTFIGNLDLGNIALIISGLYLASAAWTATKTAFVALLKTNIMSVVGGLGTVNAGTVAVSVLLAASIGWKIGTKIYESASGHEVEQGFIDEITDIWNGFTKDKVKFNLLDFIEFTVEDADGWYGDYRNWVNDLVDCITEDFETLKTSVESAWDSVWYGKGTTAHGYNGATSEAVRYIEGTGQGYDSELNEKGANLWNGIFNGFDKAMKVTNPLIIPIEWLKDKFAKWWADTFEEHSPARAVYPLGENLWLGIYNGFKEAMEKFSLSELINDLSVELLGTGQVKTGKTAQGNFNRSTDKTHSNKGNNTVTYKINTETQINGTKKSSAEINSYAEAYNNLFTEANQSASATHKLDVGGQISSIDDVTDWKNKFHNLRQTWTSKDATLTAKEDGLANGNVANWIKQFDEKKKSWTDKTSTLSVKQSGLESFGDENKGYIKQLNQVKSKWQGSSATFNVDLKGNIGSSTELTNVANAAKSLNDNFPSGNHSATWSATLSGTDTNSLNAYAGAVKNVYDNFYTGEHTASYSVSISGDTSGADTWISNVASKLAKKISEQISGTSSKGSTKFYGNANGGIISGNNVFNIPQYAGGTLNAGSVFVAGESGPEVMGHINGRTEILNRSQIASIMNNSFVSAMAQFGNRMLASPETVAYRSSSYQGYTPTSTNGDSIYLAEQNQLLREQNQLLAEILEKPTGISSRDVFNATRSEAQSYYNRTGNSAFM